MLGNLGFNSLINPPSLNTYDTLTTELPGTALELSLKQKSFPSKHWSKQFCLETLMVGAGLTTTVNVLEHERAGPVALYVTVYVPSFGYEYTGSLDVDVPTPSPKFQFQEVNPGELALKVMAEFTQGEPENDGLHCAMTSCENVANKATNATINPLFLFNKL